MTEDEILQAAERNTFVRFCGIELHADEQGNYYTTAELKPEHHNPYGIAHGGLLYTMADTTAGNNARRFARQPVTLNSDFHFLKNTGSGTLKATAEVVQHSRKILVIRSRVLDEQGDVLAEGCFTFYDRAHA